MQLGSKEHPTSSEIPNLKSNPQINILPLFSRIARKVHLIIDRAFFVWMVLGKRDLLGVVSESRLGSLMEALLLNNPYPHIAAT